MKITGIVAAVVIFAHTVLAQQREIKVVWREAAKNVFISDVRRTESAYLVFFFYRVINDKNEELLGGVSAKCYDGPLTHHEIFVSGGWRRILFEEKWKDVIAERNQRLAPVKDAMVGYACTTSFSRPLVSSGMGSGTGGRHHPDEPGEGPEPDVITPYRIVSEPVVVYTEMALNKGIQGSVVLKITLLASGKIGTITPIKTLRYGLTEAAMAAAKMIRFEPKKINGVPQSVIITREYTFSFVVD